MKTTRWMPYLLLLLTVLFWSGNFVLGRGVRELIPPVSLNFWRWAGAFFILLPFSAARIWRQRQLMRAHWQYLAIMAVLGISIFNTFIYTALHYTTATNTTLVNAMIPIDIVLLTWLIFGQRLHMRQAAGVMASLVGLLFIITRGDLTALQAFDFSIGDLWTLVAGVVWALYSVFLRRRPEQMDPIAFLTVVVGLGIVFLLPFYIGEVAMVGGFELSAPALFSLIYVCIFPSVLSFIFWNRGVQMVGANQAGIFMHLMPVFSILMAIAFLGENLYWFHLAGMVLIFSGILMTTWPLPKTATT